MDIDIKKDVNPSLHEAGIIIARFQVHELHEAHKALIDKVRENHKKVLIILGVPHVNNSKRNPLDFATRKIMIQEAYPDVVILPNKDNRSNEAWSENVDNLIDMAFGVCSPLLYGGRDSFIPHYSGKYVTTELVTDVYYSGTEIRKEVSREILGSPDFRAGIIHSCYSQYPRINPTVDVVAHRVNDGKHQILLAQKPNEDKWRFIGGHVDKTDEDLEKAARREFSEETGGCAIDGLKYVCSYNVPDWRYKSLNDGIITTLYFGTFQYGSIQPSDDISALKWIDINTFGMDGIYVEETDMVIVEEHLYMMQQLVKKWETLIK